VLFQRVEFLRVERRGCHLSDRRQRIVGVSAEEVFGVEPFLFKKKKKKKKKKGMKDEGALLRKVRE